MLGQSRDPVNQPSRFDAAKQGGPGVIPALFCVYCGGGFAEQRDGQHAPGL
jgi:hypothetical protein